MRYKCKDIKKKERYDRINQDDKYDRCIIYRFHSKNIKKIAGIQEIQERLAVKIISWNFKKKKIQVRLAVKMKIVKKADIVQMKRRKNSWNSKDSRKAIADGYTK